MTATSLFSTVLAAFLAGPAVSVLAFFSALTAVVLVITASMFGTRFGIASARPGPEVELEPEPEPELVVEPQFSISRVIEEDLMLYEYLCFWLSKLDSEQRPRRNGMTEAQILASSIEGYLPKRERGYEGRDNGTEGNPQCLCTIGGELGYEKGIAIFLGSDDVAPLEYVQREG